MRFSLLPSALTPLIRRRVALWLGVTAFLTYGFFANGIGDGNTDTRLALAVSIVQSHRLTIDPYAGGTNDKAFLNGHYYSDKAPGMSFMALPIVAAVSPRTSGVGASDAWFSHRPAGVQFVTLEYLVELLTSALPMALAVGVLFLIALRIGASPDGALFAAIGFGWGTPAWGWATTIFEHAAGTAFLFLSFAGVIILTQKRAAKSWMRCLLGFAIGLLMGWNVVVELISAPAVLLIALFGLWRLRPELSSSSSGFALVAATFGGGVIGVLPLLIYNRLAFGAPFNFGYGHVVGFAQMQQGFFGINLPNPSVAAALVFGPYRGILWLSPLLAFAPWAILRLSRLPGRTDIAILSSGIAVYYLLLNSGYAYWDGGWSTGPRHLTPVVSFLCLPMFALWDQASQRLRILLLVVLGSSIALSLACAMVGMNAAPSTSANLVFDYLIPNLKWGAWDGILMFRTHILSPVLTIFPLLAIWIFAAFAWLTCIARPAAVS